MPAESLRRARAAGRLGAACADLDSLAVGGNHHAVRLASAEGDLAAAHVVLGAAHEALRGERLKRTTIEGAELGEHLLRKLSLHSGRQRSLHGVAHRITPANHSAK